jgi:ABC-type nitrate/sulfonate/bicarbonate transport system permease component
MALGTLSIVVFLVVWEVASRLELVNPLFTSRPSAIWTAALDMYVYTGDMWPHLQISLYEAGVGFILSGVVGIPVGILLGTSRTLRQLTEPFLNGLYSTPQVAFFPLLIVWFGIGSAPKIMLIFLGGVFPFIINTQSGVESVSRQLIECARSFRASSWALLTKVLLPASLPYVLAGTRLALGRVLIMMFVGQLVLANRGLGYVVSNAGVTFQTDRLFVGVLTLTVIGMGLTQALRVLEERKFAYFRIT